MMYGGTVLERRVLVESVLELWPSFCHSSEAVHRPQSAKCSIMFNSLPLPFFSVGASKIILTYVCLVVDALMIIARLQASVSFYAVLAPVTQNPSLSV